MASYAVITVTHPYIYDAIRYDETDLFNGQHGRNRAGTQPNGANACHVRRLAAGSRAAEWEVHGFTRRSATGRFLPNGGRRLGCHVCAPCPFSEARAQW